MSEFNTAIVDALELWAEGKGGFSEPTLPRIGFDGNERYLLLFTAFMQQVPVHFEAEMRSYVRCNGPDCVLDKVGRQAIDRYTLPVYDPLGKFVAVIPVSPSRRPQALLPQLIPHLKNLPTSGPVLIGIREGSDRASFEVRSFPLPENADDGATVIPDFLQRLKDGAIDLGSVYPRQSNESLAALPEVERLMKLRGIKLA
jgi:hypothetical protein